MRQDPPEVHIGIEPPFEEDVLEMIEALDSYLASLYPSSSNHLVNLDSLMGKNVRFLVARVDGRAAGCGALLLDPRGYVEVKRMYVKPDARRLGIGAAVLRQLELLAVQENHTSLRLEAGVNQPEALEFYRRAGYIECGPFGDYALDPLSVFMEKTLSEIPGHPN